MKLKAKTKDCHLIVKAKMSFGEHIDTMELDRFSRAYLRGFLKPQLVKKNLIEYTGPVGISLYERMKKPISKHDFFYIMEHIVVAMQKIQGNKLSPNKLILDIHNVYINEVTKEVQFLYIPRTESVEDINIIQFIESIIYSANPMPEQDTEYISRFTHFLRGLRLFNTETVEKYIAGEDRSVVNAIKKNNAGQSGFITNKRQQYYDYYDKKEAEADDTPTGLLHPDEEATGIMGDDCPTGILNEEDEETGILGSEEGTALLDDVGTTLLDDESNWYYVHFPSLFRVLTEETISINKPVFRLGKEKSYVDYFINNNNAVSRSHADIITRGNRYYVVDQNSKNRTYINGTPLPVKYEVEINDGDRLKLGNEEFVFYA